MFSFPSDSGNGAPPTRKEIKATTREADRTIRKGQRELEKELYDCNRQEKDLISKIQAAHKQSKDAEVKSLARQLVRVREAKERLQKCTGQLSSVQMNTKAMAMNATLASSVAGAAQALASVNKVVDPAQVMRTMNQFSTEVDKMEVAQESWDDLMDVFDGEGVEAEADNIVDGVLDELGISMGQQLDAAGVVPQSHVSSEADRLLSELGISSPPTVYKFAGNPAANPAL